MSVSAVVSLSFVAIAIALACALVLLRRMRASGTMQGSASRDEETPWTIAGGLAIGPLHVSGAAMRGGVVAWQVVLFGKTVARRDAAHARAPSDDVVAKKKSKLRAALERRAMRWLCALDPAATIELALDAFAHVRVESLDARVRCGAVDPLLAGRVAGVMAVLSGALAPIATIRTTIDWAAEDDALDIAAEGQASFVPLVVTWDLARFVAKQAFAPLLRVFARARASLRRLPIADINAT